MIEADLDHVRSLSPEHKKTVAIEAIKDLTTESKKAVAAEVAGNLGAEGKKDVAVELGQDLSRKDRADLIQRLRPTQPVTDLVWKVIIISFAIVFVGSAAGLIVAALWKPEQIQILLTVVTTIAGFLAGFLSGKADA